jgi:hypothetical protein
LLACLVAMPEWFLVLAVLGATSALGLARPPLLLALPFLLLGIAASVAQAALGAKRAQFSSQPTGRRKVFLLRALTALLHLIQPLARLQGRLTSGLTPWRVRGRPSRPAFFPHTVAIWSESWRTPEVWLADLESTLRSQQVPVRRGGDFDRWDLEVRGALLGAAAVRAAVEDHGSGRQLVRFHVRPRLLVRGWLITLALLTAAFAALMSQVWLPGAMVGAAGLLVLARAAQESAVASGSLLDAIARLGQALEWKREPLLIVRLLEAQLNGKR